MNWTAESLRQQLPTIKVKMLVTGEVLDGRIAGRQNEFATVTIWLPHYQLWHSEEYPWQTLANVLNDYGTLIW